MASDDPTIEMLDEKFVKELEYINKNFEETALRFQQAGVQNTIVFFGSAQICSYADAQHAMREVELRFDNSKRRTQQQWDALDRASNAVYMSRYYHAAEDLAQKLSTWSKRIKEQRERFIICSGGGPGIMEAANKGASKAKARTIGLRIDIPLEQQANFHITPELTFCFDHFLLRKYWFFKFAKAMVIFPGGMGTLDEVFEILTLIKTKKIKRKVPIVFYGSEYWKEVVNFENMIRYNTIEPEDLDCMIYADDVDTAYKHITKELKKHYLDPAKK